MFPSVQLYVLFVSVCAFHNTTSREFLQDGIVKREVKAIQRRGLVIPLGPAAQRGLIAVRVLLQGAKPVSKINDHSERLVKSGGARQMMKDFSSVKMDYVSRFKLSDGVVGRAGRVGDKIVIARNKGKLGKPSLEIIQVNGGPVDRAVDTASIFNVDSKFPFTQEIVYID